MGSRTDKEASDHRKAQQEGKGAPPAALGAKDHLNGTIAQSMVDALEDILKSERESERLLRADGSPN